MVKTHQLYIQTFQLGFEINLKKCESILKSRLALWPDKNAKDVTIKLKPFVFCYYSTERIFQHWDPL